MGGEAQSRGSAPRSATTHFLFGLARAFAGAVIFALPLIMTMEMWTLGPTMDRGRLALFLVLVIPLLVGLSYVSGFEDTETLRHDVVDAFVAYAVGFVAAAALLSLLAVLEPADTLGDLVGKTALQAVPASIGALLAHSQFGRRSKSDERKRRDAGYPGDLFLMAAGALFFSFNIAPTEEMRLLALRAREWHLAATVLVSLLVMHAFVYGVEFAGQQTAAAGRSGASIFLRYTVTGYAIVLLASAYVLWTFGRLDGLALLEVVSTVVVLAFAGAIGAAAARLIL